VRQIDHFEVVDALVVGEGAEGEVTLAVGQPATISRRRNVGTFS
jgi:hypothetical protein